jgi:hypothetical protein
MTTPLSKPLHVIAQELRLELNTILPDNIGVTINTREEADGTGSITLTVSDWPKTLQINNIDRLVAARIAILNGEDVSRINLSNYPYLSATALDLVKKLQDLVDRHCPPRLSAETQTEEWPIAGYVAFNPRAMQREKTELLHSLLTTSLPPSKSLT